MKLHKILVSTILLTFLVSTSLMAASSSTEASASEETTIFNICRRMVKCMTGLSTPAAWHKEGRAWGQNLSEELDKTMERFLQTYNDLSLESGEKAVALRDLVDVLRTFIEDSHHGSSQAIEFVNRLFKFVQKNFIDRGIKLNLDRIESAWEHKFPAYKAPEIQEELTHLINANKSLTLSD